jgi:hypothetical protein
MLRKLVLVAVVAVLGASSLGCGGPGETTTVPEDKRVGLGKPGGDGPGHFKDPEGNDMPEGLAPVPD